MLAPYVCYPHDSGHGTLYDPARWPQGSQNDGQGLSPSHCTNWRILQLVAHLRQLDVPIPQRGFHSNVEGL